MLILHQLSTIELQIFQILRIVLLLKVTIASIFCDKCVDKSNCYCARDSWTTGPNGEPNIVIVCFGKVGSFGMPNIIRNTTQCNEYNFAKISLALRLQNFLFDSTVAPIVEINTSTMDYFEFEIDSCPKLKTIEESAFTGIHGSSIKSIAITSAALTGIPFAALSSLTYGCQADPPSYDFSSNLISSIGSNSFSLLMNSIRCNQIKSLNLQHNSIIELQPYAFAGVQVTTLTLGYNSIAHIADYAFYSAATDSLDLSQTTLKDTAVNAKSLEGLRINMNLLLSGNKFISFPSDTLAGISWACSDTVKIIEISLQDNKIRTLEADQFMFLNSENLSSCSGAVVNLFENNIYKISQHAFFNATKLSTVNLLSNPIKYIEARAFETARIQNLLLSLDILSNDAYFSSGAISSESSEIASVQIEVYNFDYRNYVASEFSCMRDSNFSMLSICNPKLQSITFRSFCKELFEAVACKSALGISPNAVVEIDVPQASNTADLEVCTSMPCSQCSLIYMGNISIATEHLGMLKVVAMCSNKSYCFSLNDFTAASTLILSYRKQSTICERSLALLWNTTIQSLILSGSFTYQKIPLVVLQLARLKLLQIDTAIICDCPLAVYFKDYFSNRTLNASCSNAAVGDAYTYIMQNYKTCTDTTDQYSYPAYDSYDCQQYCYPTENLDTTEGMYSLIFQYCDVLKLTHFYALPSVHAILRQCYFKFFIRDLHGTPFRSF